MVLDPVVKAPPELASVLSSKVLLVVSTPKNSFALVVNAEGPIIVGDFYGGPTAATAEIRDLAYVPDGQVVEDLACAWVINDGQFGCTHGITIE